MSWDRQTVSAALVDMLGPATGVTVHPIPPEVLNPPCVVVSRPQTVSYSTAAPTIDEATLPLIVCGGIETEDAVEATKTVCRQTILADPSLAGTVQACWPSEERNWRNITGAGGVQLLLVELVLQIQM
jgi:hypothetical protein